VVLGDAGYGVETAFRAALAEAGLAYVLGVQSSASLWPPGEAPLPAPPYAGRGRPPTRVRRAPGHEPVAAKKLAEGLPPRAWRTVTWREGSRTGLSSRFAALRVRPAHRDTLRPGPWPEEWLLVEWPEGETQLSKYKYWLSTLPADISFRQLVDITKMRWRIERDYQELKQEIGLGHYEGRGWRGFHHHATLCVAAYGFLVRERAAIPPSGPRSPARLSTPDLPDGYRPRGSALAA
jgi:SRSO17 transposase